MKANKNRYKLFGIVTNRALEANELIAWHRRRCGDSEKVHHVQKSELAGGQFPSGLFGANAAWWHIMILAFNLNQVMKSHALPKALKSKAVFVNKDIAQITKLPLKFAVLSRSRFA